MEKYKIYRTSGKPPQISQSRMAKDGIFYVYIDSLKDIKAIQREVMKPLILYPRTMEGPPVIEILDS